MAAKNYQLPTQEVSWLQRDQLVFAISIGVSVEELNFVFVWPKFRQYIVTLTCTGTK